MRTGISCFLPKSVCFGKAGAWRIESLLTDEEQVEVSSLLEKVQVGELVAFVRGQAGVNVEFGGELKRWLKAEGGGGESEHQARCCVRCI